MTTRTVFTNSLGYNQRRNYAALPFTRYQVKKQPDLTRVPLQLSYRTCGWLPLTVLHSHLRPLKSALHHFFNTISFSRIPWLTTFETALPRWETSPHWLTRRGLDAMASPYCQALIAFSNCTQRIQDKFLADHFPAYRDQIMSKCRVLHPSQAPLISDYGQKRLPRRLRVVLVGNQVFSKGGREAVRVVRRLGSQGADIELQLVSGLVPDGYATRTTKADVVKLRGELAEAARWVTFRGSLPNQKVLKLLRDSHLALLTTYADTYGYILLEAQASGSPVISTDIRVLPEINDDQHGWIIPLPQDDRGNAVLATEEDRRYVSGIIEEHLEQYLSECLNDRAVLEQKGKTCLQRIQREHDVASRVTALQTIYDRAA